MIQKLLLPTLVPSKRFSSTIISIILASAIFSGTVLGISTLDQQSTNFFDTRPNTAIVFDTTVNTPFTSRIPQEVLKSLDVLPGVNSYSGEILQPALIGNRPTFYRGVNLTNLMQFDPTFELIETNLASNELQPTSALIGEILQSRFDLKMGDVLLVTSTITGRSIQVRVDGFFTSDLPYRFEILLSLPTAQYLASFTGQLTHVQVNYDTNMLDEKTITAILTQKFEFLVIIGFDNGSKISELQLSVFDSQNKGIISGPANASQLYFLHAGTYRVVLKSPNNVLYDEKIALTEDTSITIRTGEYAYDVAFNLTYGNLPYFGFNYTIFSANINETGFSPSSVLNLELRPDNYTFVVPLGNKPLIYSFIVNGSSTFSIDVSSLFPKILFSKPQNAIFIDSEFTLSVQGLLPEQKAVLKSINGTQIENALKIDQSHELIGINVPDGSYQLEIIETKTLPELVIATYSFSVNTSIDLFANSLTQYGHYLPAEQVTISTKPNAYTDLIVFANGMPLNYSINDNLINLKLPSTVGIYSVDFVYIDHTGKTNVRSFSIIIDELNALAGWRLSTQSPEIYTNISYPIWHRGNVINVSENWTYVPVSPGFGYLIATTVGNDTNLELTLTTGTASLNLTRISSPITKLGVRNSTGSILNLQQNQVVNTSDMIFEFDEKSYRISMDLGGELYEITPGFPYSFPSTVVNVTVQMFQKIGTDFISISNITFSVNDTFDFPDIPVPHYQFTNNSVSGIFILDDLSYTFKFLNGSIFEPSRLPDSKIVLPPNDYRVIVSDISNLNFTFFLTVPKFITSQSFFIQNKTQIYSSDGYIIAQNETVSLKDGIYFTANDIFAFISSSQISSLPPTLMTTNSEINIAINGARYIKYSISFENGTTKEFGYNMSIYLSSSKTEKFDLKVTVIDHFGQVKYYMSLIGLNQQIRTYTLNIIMRDNSSFPDYGIDVLINQIGANELHIGQSNTLLTLLDTEIIIQKVSTLGVQIPFDFKVDYVLREIELQIFDPWMTVYTQNFNEGSLVPYQGNVLIVDIKTGTTVFNDTIGQFEKLPLSSSNYSITIIVDETQLTYNFSIEISKKLLIPLPIHFQVISVAITKLGNFFVKEVHFRHKILDIDLKGEPVQKSSELEIWSISSFPYGDLEIEIFLSNGKKHVIRQITTDTVSFSIEVTFDFSGLNDRFADPSLLNKGAINVNLGATSSSNYLESFLGNLITLVRLVFLAELIVISFILVINILRSIDFFVILSKKELRTLLSIGNSQAWSIGLISRELILLTPVLSFMGYLLGFGLLSYFVELNHLTLFGKDLVFEFWNWNLILLNLFAVLLMVIVSVFVEIRRISMENLNQS